MSEIVKCGTCGLGVRSGDNTVPLRVPEGQDKEPGLYAACPDCVRKYAPAICAKLSREGHHFTPETLPGNFLR